MHKTTRVVVLSPSFDPEQYKAWRDDDGNTLLHLAAWEGNLEAVKFLFPKVDINAKNNNGNTPLHFAASIPNNSQVITELAKELAKTGEIDIMSNNGFTALHYAAGTGQTKNVEALLKFQTEYNISDNDGRTALHIAAKEGKTEAVEALLKKGASSELADTHDKYTALHLAAMNGHNNAVVKLIKFGAVINATDNRGIAAIHMAALCDRPEVVVTLIKSGVNVDSQNGKYGDTALHMSVKKGNIEAIRALMNEGASVDIKNKKGETAIDIANRIENESYRDAVINLLSAKSDITSESSKRIEIGALLNSPDNDILSHPASEPKRRPYTETGKEGPPRVASEDRADQLVGSGARSLG